MALAALLNLPLTPAQVPPWSFCHAANHTDIIRVIFDTAGVNLSAFILDPFNPFDPVSLEVWLANHQITHQQMNAVLGISGYDLSDVDWQDQESLFEWLQANFQEHLQASTALGLG